MIERKEFDLDNIKWTSKDTSLWPDMERLDAIRF